MLHYNECTYRESATKDCKSIWSSAWKQIVNLRSSTFLVLLLLHCVHGSTDPQTTEDVWITDCACVA